MTKPDQKSNTYDILVVGDYYVDLVFTGLTDQVALGKEIFAQDLAIVPGGAYNFVAASHALGLRVAWACDFGNDPFSAWIKERARADGIEGTYFSKHNRPLRFITVSVSYQTDRAFITYEDKQPSIPSVLKTIQKINARCLYIPGLLYGPVLDIGKILKPKRIEHLFMDGNLGNSEPNLTDASIARAIKNQTIFFCNRREALILTREDDIESAGRRLADLGTMIIIKDGGSGASLFHQGMNLHVDAIPIKPVDTTGAGDCFNAGFIHYWLAGSTLKKCLQFANIVGGLSTLNSGGSTLQIDEKKISHWLTYYDRSTL